MVKINRKVLDNYRRFKREIPLLELELADMQLGDTGMGNSTVFDYRDGFPRPQSVVGFDWPKYERRKKALERRKEVCKAVEEWIEAIEDGQARCVFRMFYVDGMTWEKIASKIGYHGSPDYPRLHIRDKYLQKVGIK